MNVLIFFRKDHEKAEFEVHEVYAVDVLISTGEGKVSVLFSHLYIFFHFSFVDLHQTVGILLSFSSLLGQRFRSEDHNL